MTLLDRLNQAKADIESGALFSENAKACIGAAHREMTRHGNITAVDILIKAAYEEDRKFEKDTLFLNSFREAKKTAAQRVEARNHPVSVMKG